jgi:hypothetical protein
MQVYAVVLRKHNVCNPTTEDIIPLKMTKGKGLSGGVQWKLDKTNDAHHPFFAYITSYQEKGAAFSFTGTRLHEGQGPGRLWLFRSRKSAKTFREGFFAYKIFLGACMSGDDSRV